MVKLLNLKVCRVVLGITFPAVISAIGSLVVGIIIMHTFYATNIKTAVGIWAGALMILHITVGILVYLSRHYLMNLLYLLTSIAVAALTIFGAILSYEYWNKFSDYRTHNDNKICSLQQRMCTCAGKSAFDEHFASTDCGQYAKGQGFWLGVFILCIINAVWAVIGLVCSIVLLVKVTLPSDDEEDEEVTDEVDGYYNNDAISIAKSTVSSMRVM